MGRFVFAILVGAVSVGAGARPGNETEAGKRISLLGFESGNEPSGALNLHSSEYRLVPTRAGYLLLAEMNSDSRAGRPLDSGYYARLKLNDKQSALVMGMLKNLPNRGLKVAFEQFEDSPYYMIRVEGGISGILRFSRSFENQLGWPNYRHNLAAGELTDESYVRQLRDEAGISRNSFLKEAGAHSSRHTITLRGRMSGTIEHARYSTRIDSLEKTQLAVEIEKAAQTFGAGVAFRTRIFQSCVNLLYGAEKEHDLMFYGDYMGVRMASSYYEDKWRERAVRMSPALTLDDLDHQSAR